MIKTIIIDDEQHCIDRLENLIDNNFDDVLELKGSFKTVEEGLNGIKQFKPALIFLDVEINDKTGFEIGRAHV